MGNFEFGWDSADGIHFFGQGWAPDKPKAVVCLVHGLGEHAGRYAHVGKAFSEAGYALLGFDLRGHGKSGGQRGHAPSMEALMDDVDRLLKEAGTRYPGLPRFVYGHSLGGEIVLYHGLRRKPEVRGVIATGSSLRTSIELQKGKVALVKLLGSILPRASIATGLVPETLSRDTKVVELYRKDPLVHNKMSFGLGKIFLAVNAYCLERAAEFTLPLLIMHGKEDKLAFPSGSVDFAAKVKGDCSLKLWEGLTHEVHNEPEKAEVLAFIVAWMDGRLGGR